MADTDDDEKACAVFLQHRKGKRNLMKGRYQRFGKRWGSGGRLTGFRRGGRSGKGAGKSRPGSWLKGKSGFGKPGKGYGKSKGKFGKGKGKGKFSKGKGKFSKVKGKQTDGNSDGPPFRKRRW